MEKDQRGYTLIEVLVAVSVFAILATISIVNIRITNRNEDLRLSSQEFVLHLREAQSMAMNGRQQNNAVPPGYGVYIGNTCESGCQYSLFSDIDGDYKYSSGDKSVTAYSLPSSVQIIRINNGTEQAPYSIGFSAPNGKSYFQGALGADVSIFLKHQLNNQCKEIILHGNIGYIDDRSVSCPQ